MGLTSKSTGINAVDSGLTVKKEDGDTVIALAGNPNVGKSTVFNALTRMNQHTGNWPGKTVSNAQGVCRYNEKNYIFVDIPGTYSLMAHSTEEEVARDFICFGDPDTVVVVCDATCLERNLNLVLQTIEITPKVVVCVNLLDEAKKKKIKVDIEGLQKQLGVSVVGAVARNENGLDELMKEIEKTSNNGNENAVKIEYESDIEEAVSLLMTPLQKLLNGRLNPKWTAVRLLDGDKKIIDTLSDYLGEDIYTDEIKAALKESAAYLESKNISATEFKDKVISSIITKAEKIAQSVTEFEKDDYYERDRKLDRVLTNRIFGVPIMIVMLALVFWITITGANYPSELLSNGLFWVGDRLKEMMVSLSAPEWLCSVTIDGVYKVLAWVISVMLPPMAIFFPLFTLLEDSGYLPRIAFNLDKHFKKANACGKQALTMCMGFGCNAAGIVGCRIIDSPRERLIAILTNNFVPCNGRFPTIIAIISMFFIGSAFLPFKSVVSALMLTGVIVLGVCITFIVSRILSKTILKGVPSSFTLELPPYRRPQILKVIVRSIFDRTLFVLGRAVLIAIPAGLIIWIMANISVGGATLLAHCSEFLDPFAHFFGLDGVILLAFILGFPANEIVVPIIIMTYMAQGSLLDMSDLTELKSLLVENGWTWVTALCTMLFSLLHWPCSTTCLTIKKETGGIKWTIASFLIPTIVGLAVCAVVANVCRLFL